MNLKIPCGIKTIGNNEDATKSPQYGVEVFFLLRMYLSLYVFISVRIGVLLG